LTEKTKGAQPLVHIEDLPDQREYGPNLTRLAAEYLHAFAAREHVLTTNSGKLGQGARPIDMDEECAML
jgi:hypothetical protein